MNNTDTRAAEAIAMEEEVVAYLKDTPCRPVSLKERVEIKSILDTLNGIPVEDIETVKLAVRFKKPDGSMESMFAAFGHPRTITALGICLANAVSAVDPLNRMQKAIKEVEAGNIGAAIDALDALSDYTNLVSGREAELRSEGLIEDTCDCSGCTARRAHEAKLREASKN